jgi:hypothetical protein
LLPSGHRGPCAMTHGRFCLCMQAARPLLHRGPCTMRSGNLETDQTCLSVCACRRLRAEKGLMTDRHFCVCMQAAQSGKRAGAVGCAAIRGGQGQASARSGGSCAAQQGSCRPTAEGVAVTPLRWSSASSPAMSVYFFWCFLLFFGVFLLFF